MLCYAKNGYLLYSISVAIFWDPIPSLSICPYLHFVLLYKFALLYFLCCKRKHSECCRLQFMEIIALHCIQNRAENRWPMTNAIRQPSPLNSIA